MTSDNEIDRAIDLVAREMSTGDASANLRARVLAGIESPRPFAWRPLAAAAAVAAALIMAVVLPRGRVPSPIQAPARAGVEPAPPAASRTDAQGERRNADKSRAGHARPLRSVVNPFSEDPLTENPLVMESIGTDPIALEQLPSIAPIAVTPLDAQGESQ